MAFQEIVVKGTRWSVLSQVVRQGISFAVTVVLAHLLSPSDFGLMNMAIVVTGFLDLFRDLGASAGVIHNKDQSEDLLSSIFWMNVLVGFVIMIGLVLLAPFVASFYKESGLVPILRFLSVGFFISSLSLLQQAILQKNIEFLKFAKVEILANILGALIGVTFALCGFGIWSLVYQNLSSVLTMTVLLWATSGWRPKAVFRWSEVRKISKFSLNFAGLSISNFLSRNIDYILIGRFLGVQSLGYYSLAYRLMLLPASHLVSFLVRVIFPIYCKVGMESHRFVDTFLKLSSSIAAIIFPCLFGAWALNDLFVSFFYGPHWVVVSSLIFFLAPLGIIRTLVAIGGVIGLIKGRTDLLLRLGLFSDVTVVIAICIGLKWGIMGVSACYAFASLIMLYPYLAFSFGLIHLRVIDFFRALLLPFCLSSSMVVLVLIGKHFSYIFFSSRTLQFLLLALFGVAFYISASWVINRDVFFRCAKLFSFRSSQISISE